MLLDRDADRPMEADQAIRFSRFSAFCSSCASSYILVSPFIDAFLPFHDIHIAYIGFSSSSIMASPDVTRKLWEHPDPRSTQMYILMQEINRKQNLQLEVYSSTASPCVCFLS